MKDIYWINLVRALCMCLVYLYHTEYYCDLDLGDAFAFYSPFFTNAFFFISGYLLFCKLYKNTIPTSKEWFSTVGKKMLGSIFCKIAIPSVIFSALFYFPKKIIRHQPFDIDSFWGEVILGDAKWFTSALVIAELLLFTIFLFRLNKGGEILFLSLIFVWLANQLHDMNICMMGSNNAPWFYKSALIAVFFMVVGGFYFMHESTLDNYFKRWRCLIFNLFIYVSVIGYFIMSNLSLDIIELQLESGKINATSIIFELYSIIIIVMLCKKMPKLHFCDWLGRNTLPFYFLSGAIPNIVAIYLGKYLDKTSYFYIFSTFMASVCISVPIVYVLITYCSVLFDIRKLSLSKTK